MAQNRGSRHQNYIKSVKDKELHELRSMADKLSPPDDQPELVQEKREVPTSDAILGNLISRIPEHILQVKKPAILYRPPFKNSLKLTHTMQLPPTTYQK